MAVTSEMTKRTAAMMQIRFQLGGDQIAEEPDLDGHACGSQRGDSPPSDPPVRVVHTDHDPGDAGGHDRVDARWGSSVVRARFQRHHQRRAHRRGARSGEGDHLGVRTPCGLGRADADDVSARVEHDSTNPRVR